MTSRGLVCDLLFSSAGHRPAHPALISGSEVKSYAVLAAEVRTLAAQLMGLGLAAQDRVGVFLDKRPEAAVAILAIAAAGAVFVPINPALQPAQVRHILNDCQIRVLIVCEPRAAQLDSSLNACPSLEIMVVLDAAPGVSARHAVRAVDWRNLMSGHGAGAGTPPAIADSDVAAILYTSGSTGRPKGVVHTHRSIVLAAHTVAEYLRYRPDDRILNLPPYSFGFGLSQLFTALATGATAVLHTFLSADDLLSTIAEHRVTGVSGVPTVITQLIAAPWPPEAAACVRYVSVAGGRLPEASSRLLRETHPHIDLYLMYGMTETLRSTYLPPEEVDRRPNSIGKAIPNADVRVLRADGAPCLPGEPGELVHGGPLIAQGYWNDPTRTQEVFRDDPDADGGRCVWSGDIVTCDKDGFLYFVGRRDDMLKLRGHRVSPLEIEEVLVASGGVLAAAVLLDPAMKSDPDLVACVTPREGGAVDVAAILAYCRQELPGYMTPRRILTLKALPTTPNGKLDRRALADLVAKEEPPPPPAAVRGRGFLQHWKEEAARIIGLPSAGAQTVLQLFQWAFPGGVVSPASTFRSLGGDSLNYVTVSIGLEALIGDLPEAWEAMPLSRLEAQRRAHVSSAKLRPEVALRAMAILAIVGVHMGHGGISGGSFFLLLLSGWSFARFTWHRNPMTILASVSRLMIRVIIPTWIMLLITFAVRRHVDWGVLLFFDNWLHPAGVSWWVPAWFLQVLFQIFLVMAAAGAVPALARLGRDHCFVFGALLFGAGLAATVAQLVVLPKHLLAYQCLPQFYFWVFALGWMTSVAVTPAKKLITCLALAAGIGLACALLGRTGAFVVIGHGGFWLAAGVPALLFAPPVVAPTPIARSANLLAQASLFAYVFHWPIANAIQRVVGLGHDQFRFAAGFLGSLAIWFVWEASLRAYRATGPHPWSALWDRLAPRERAGQAALS